MNNFDALVLDLREKVKESEGLKGATIAVCDTAHIIREWLLDHGYEPDIRSVLDLVGMILTVRDVQRELDEAELDRMREKAGLK